ncbi:uncharacterized protein DUF397 [Nocardiopsis sp. Huas11]|uniref:DUF397 domain-containing protein n=1 Tax=Nocardiopsis sp. Huas11 TaxID=2183912 RepID=UPI000EB1DE2F|nr:DUF397 domain-containing protein [Nocardiopsis sp. Huas11]RKS07908.1 uncharacterized protein DUF397 [Nocardiopsis sp. Huas11]
MKHDESAVSGWRISSYSADTGRSCVEVGWTPGAAAVRDSTQRGLGYLAFEPQAWASLTSALKQRA